MGMNKLSRLNYNVDNRNIFYIFILTMFIFSPNIFLYINFTHLLIIFFFVFLFSLLGLVSSRLYFLFSVPIVFLSVIFSHIYIHWGPYGISSRLQAAMLSPTAETVEYLKTYLGLGDLVLIFYMIISLLLIYRYSKTEHKNCQLKKELVFLLLILTLSIFTIKNPLKGILPFNLPYMYIEAGDWVGKAKERMRFLKNSSHSISEKNKMYYDRIVVVIGESASRHHMSVYGYDKNTTPFFNSLKENNESLFLRGVSPANQTRFAIPMELTEAGMEDFEKFFHTYSIVSILKKAGYETYWISNQAKVGKYDTYVTTIANEAKYTMIENQNFGSSKPDSILLKKLSSVPLNDGKDAFFIHLMGSHFNYKDRYEQEHTLFHQPRNIVEEYDNSIFYTDFVLKNIFRHFISKKEKTLFIYFSDHAEVVSPRKHGHGFLPPVREVFDVPLFIYSTAPDERFEKLKSRFSDNAAFVNLESVYDIIMYLNGSDDSLSKISSRNMVSASSPDNLVIYSTIEKFDPEKYKKEKKE